MSIEFDIVMPYHSKDIKVVTKCLESCRKYVVGLRNIYVIANETCDFDIEGVFVFNENSFYKTGEPSKEYIRKFWHDKNPELAHRAGWILQQFLELGASYTIEDLTDFYLTVDSDIVFLKPFNISCGDGRYALPIGREPYQPYLDCYEKLLNMKPEYLEHNLVTGLMMFKKDIVIEMLNEIESIHSMKWYDAILNNMDCFSPSPFAEFETYGQYVYSKHKDIYELKQYEYLSGFKKIPNLDDFTGKADYMILNEFLLKRKWRGFRKTILSPKRLVKFIFNK